MPDKGNSFFPSFPTSRPALGAYLASHSILKRIKEAGAWGSPLNSIYYPGYEWQKLYLISPIYLLGVYREFNFIVTVIIIIIIGRYVL